ncbi:MAG TPA: TrmH family RNA methyltransferase [Thermoanaerobaculia bacterium]|nr:TrmH family RNA methyltransferase [Thermoanaerobaculia bacterium]
MIESRQNRAAKDIRRLRRSKGDACVLEGPHLVFEALALGIPLDPVLATPDFLASADGRRLAGLLSAPPLAASSEVLRSLADADSPRGLLAVAHLPRGGVETLPRAPGAPYLYLDGLQDPGNLGAVARVAEAAGAAGLALAPGSVHPNHSRALRGSAGSLLRLPVAVGATPEDLDAHLAPLAPTWAALATRGGEDLYTAELPESLILALGAEGPGLSSAVAERARLALTIPLAPPVESLNVAVAAALALFELRRRRPG